MFGSEQSRFLKRTGRSTLIVIALVSCVSSLYARSPWPIDYAIVALWSLAFFSLTALLVGSVFGPRKRPLLLGLLVVAKIVWLGLFAAALVLQVDGRPVWTLDIWAGVAGISTPLVVLILRALGARDEEKVEAGDNAATSRKSA